MSVFVRVCVFFVFVCVYVSVCVCDCVCASLLVILNVLNRKMNVIFC